MTGPERRHTSRTTGGLAYLNIEPDNAGILLNISEGGLCFHSIAPIRPNGAIRLSFSEHNCRIEAEGKLVWTSETHKTVGLEFTLLSEQAREQIRVWAIQREAAELAAPGPQLRMAPTLRSSRAAALIQPQSPPAPADAISPSVSRPTSLSGFSGGLLTGLLLSIVVAASLLFYVNRRNLGESLIRLGERMASKRPAVVQTAAPLSPPGESPREQESSASPVIPASNRKPQAQELASATSVVAESTVPTSETANPIVPPPVFVAGDAPAVTTHGFLPEQQSIMPALEKTTQPPATTEVGGMETGGAPSEMYLEVGKFKDTKAAHKAAEELAQLGFPSNVIQKGHLWMNSYYVRVGHYRDRSEAETAHRNLVSHGFKPITFEKGSRNFRFGSQLNVGDTPVSVGDCVISWESYSDSAIVKFLQDDFVVATAHGRWEKRDVRYDRGALVYRKNRDGSRTLLEIRFAGMNQALVFAQPS